MAIVTKIVTIFWWNLNPHRSEASLKKGKEKEWTEDEREKWTKITQVA